MERKTIWVNIETTITGLITTKLDSRYLVKLPSIVEGPGVSI